MMDMLRKPVVAAAKAGGYVLDGFPRTVEQAKASFPTAHALGVEVQAAVHPRRRTQGTGAPAALPAPRLRRYRSRHREPLARVPGKTVPLLEYHAGREWMFTVDGAQPPGAVHEEIVAHLQKLTVFAAWS